MAKRLKYDNEAIVADYAIYDDKGNKLSDTSTKANNSLQLPNDAPTSTQLIGVGSDGMQINLDIGDGLTVEDNTLKITGGLSSGGNFTDSLVLLWENTEDVIGTTEKFLLQEVTVQDMSPYQYLLIEFRCYTDASGDDRAIFSQIVPTEKNFYLIGGWSSALKARNVTYNSNTTLFFGSPEIVIPLKIYGIK